jgi:hypothetical protein
MQNDNSKNIFKIYFAYVTNDTAKTSIRNRLYHYTVPREMVICGSDGVTGTDRSNTNFFWQIVS